MGGFSRHEPPPPRAEDKYSGERATPSGSRSGSGGSTARPQMRSRHRELRRRANRADTRVFELLEEKLALVDGVFGASDQILGALEFGVDIDRRIFDICQHCRSAEEVEAAFDALHR